MILIVPFIIAVLYPLLPDQIYTGRHLFGSSYMGKQFVFLLGFIPYIIYGKQPGRAVEAGVHLPHPAGVFHHYLP
jgi:hypothetical protein